MSQAKHTPGPWRVLNRTTEPTGLYIIGEEKCGGSPMVASIYSQAECTAANAQLITTAPELLATCEFALSQFVKASSPEEIAITRDVLRNAIAKAKGTTT